MADAEHEAESAATSAVNAIAETAQEVIEQHNSTVETSEAINEALVDANLERVEEQRRQEHETRVNERLAEMERVHHERIAQCVTELTDLRTKLSEMEARETARMEASILAASSPPPSEREDGQRENPEVAEAEIIEAMDEEVPEVPPTPEHPAERAIRRKTRLL